MPTGKAKGVLFVHLRDYSIKNQGQSAWDKVVAAQKPGDADILKGILLAGSWYPVGLWNRTLKEYLTKHTPDAQKSMVQFADYVADRDLNTMVKMVLKVGTPEFILKRTGFLWARYFDVGNYAAEEVEPKRWKMSLEASAGDDEAAGSYTCAYGVGPWLERGLKLSGAKDPKVQHHKCRHTGNPRCEYTAQWA